MSNPIRLLLLEDSIDDAELLLAALADYGLEVQSVRVDTETDYVAELGMCTDLVLADYRLPGFSAVRAFEILTERQLDIPFIVISGAIGDEYEAELFKLGISDFVLKHHLARLGPSVTRVLTLSRARRDQARQLKELLRWQDLIIGREERMSQLKVEVNDLLARQGQLPRYAAHLEGSEDLG